MILSELLDAIESELTNADEYDRDKIKCLIEEYSKNCVCFGSYAAWRQRLFGDDK